MLECLQVLDDKYLENFVQKILLDNSDLFKRETIRQYFFKFFSDYFKLSNLKCELIISGCTANGIGIRNDNLDLYLRILNISSSYEILREFIRLINWYFSIKEHYFNVTMKKDFSLALIPKMDAENVFFCNINLLDSYGIYHSTLIKYISELSSSFLTLTTILCIWAKTNGLIDDEFNSFNSTIIAFLVIFFFQLEDIFMPIAELEIFTDFPLEFDTNKLKAFLVRNGQKFLVKQKNHLPKTQNQTCFIIKMIIKFFRQLYPFLIY